MLRPPPVRSGDRVHVIAPSGPFDTTLFFRAIAWLSQRYRVVWSRRSLEREGFLAGTDERRLRELDGALRDPEARAIVAARGGYGASRICHAADFSRLRSHPKWCIGFSDITALHLEASRVGVCSLHAANLTTLGRADEPARAAWLRALEDPFSPRSFGSLRVLVSGEARGTLAGGNLSLIFSAAASGRLVLPPRCVLFLEEVNEAPYRIDRMLTALVVGGHLRSVVGICVGGTDASGGVLDDAPALRVVQERLGELGVPIVAGMPVGHGVQNQPLPLGLPVLLSSEQRELVVNPRERSGSGVTQRCP